MELILEKLGMDFDIHSREYKFSDLTNHRLSAEIQGTYCGSPQKFIVEISTHDFGIYGVYSNIDVDICSGNRYFIYANASRITPRETNIINYINKLLNTNFDKIKILDK